MSTEIKDSPLLLSQRITQIGLFLFAFIALTGGAVQFFLGEPEVSARLDNIHRFMAGVYFGCGTICAWAAWNIRTQGTLVMLIALCGFMGGLGRVLSMSKVGIPEPHALWLGYLTPELAVPVIIVITHLYSQNQLKVNR